MNIKIIWDRLIDGKIQIKNGDLIYIKNLNSCISIDGDSFECKNENENCIIISVENASVNIGPFPTIVNILTQKEPFSFLLRDVSKEYPIYIPNYGVIVTTVDDSRSFKEITQFIKSKNFKSELDIIEEEDEESYENASKYTSDMKCMTFLGFGRDVRIFEAGFRRIMQSTVSKEAWDYIKPHFHYKSNYISQLNNEPIKYDYFVGRGMGCSQNLMRNIEDDCLPILHSELIDGDVVYTSTIFTTFEKSLSQENAVKGTHYLLADHYSCSYMMTQSQEKTKEVLLKTEIDHDNEPVIMMKIIAKNCSNTSKYCYVRIPRPNQVVVCELSPFNSHYDPIKGFGSFSEDEVFLVAQVNNKPVPSQEMSVLLKPQETLEYIFIIPHSPISQKRSEALINLNFDDEYIFCKKYWNSKLSKLTKINIPEKRIENMMKAGALHLDLYSYGREPDGPIAVTVGDYSPIGSESSPIIQYFNSVGASNVSKRALMYFFEKQHDNGQMLNYGGYSIETAAVLWTLGNFYLYTRDTNFIKLLNSKIQSACNFIIEWRNKNKLKEFTDYGYGMIDGKVGDPEDHFHLYMLNAYAYQGVKNAAILMDAIGEKELSTKYQNEADDFKECILKTVINGFAHCPVVPVGNGEWCPSLAPWPGKEAPLFFNLDDSLYYTHGSSNARDTLIGPMFLPFLDIFDPKDIYTDFIIKSFCQHFYLRNVALSQPYYSPHPFIHLLRDEIKPFLKEFYNGFSGLADRETFNFWEHYFNASPHKTHEEAWFLMRVRWLLYFENKDVLNILKGVPRKWLEKDNIIEIEGAQSYFGSLSFKVSSDLSNNKILFSGKLIRSGHPLPSEINIRLPHPDGQKAKSCTYGIYDIKMESVKIMNPNESFEFELIF